MASADPKNSPPKQPPLNGPIHVKYTTMRNVLASEIEAEVGALFVNCQRGAEKRMEIIEMGHSQAPNPEVTDSATGDEFVNDNIRQMPSRTIYMLFYWVIDRVR